MKQTIALLILWATNALGAEKWTRLSTPHFELYTTAGEKKGRDTILYFEQVRSFFATTLPSNKASETPVRIVLFRSEAQFKPYSPNDVAAAYYVPGRYRDYIVMGDSDPEHMHIAIHEYMHLIVNHSGLKVPLWMNEGLADVYSTLKPMGNKAMIGALIPGHLQVLQTQKWMSFDDLTSVDHDSRAYNEKNRAGVFYAESWALVHMLLLSPDYGDKFAPFLKAVNSGKSAAEACQIAFGRPAADVYKDFKGYLTRNRLFGSSFDVKLTRSEEEAEASGLQPLDSEIILADLLAASNKRDQAAEAYRKLAAVNPGDPDIARAMGYLAWQGNDREKAIAFFEESFAKGGRDAEMCFHLAMLELERDSSSPKAIPALERAVETKPDYLEARMQLGLAQMNAGKFPAALGTLSQIKKVDGENAATLFNALAYVYVRVGSTEDARKMTAQALKWDRTDDDKRRTADIISYLDSTSVTPKAEPKISAPGPDPNRPILARHENTPEAPAPRPAPREKLERVQGVAKNIDCDKKRFVMLADGKLVSFEMPDPQKINIRHQGTATFDFTCGPQKPFPVTVEFVEAGGGRADVKGILRTLEF